MKYTFLFYNKSSGKKEFNTDILVQIKNGNKDLHEKFINDYIPFIKSVVKKNVEIKGKIENLDEYSIALIAFDEAIKSFNIDMNRNFFGFAEMVIKRRLIDFLRTNLKSKREYPLTYFSSNTLDDDTRGMAEEYNNKVSVDDNVERIEVIEEISHFKNELKNFNIDISKLPKHVPKHFDSREICINIAKIILNNEELLDQLLNTKKLPYNKIVEKTKISRKTISKHRKYITTICLIFTNGFEHIRSFINIDIGGGDINET